eukprot:NODE_8832_length_680_cov_6.612208_g8571_i0.p1 GENE.NODE_8832_length_680_cov_6.612208_g8571_i0~~NODE_8832_length_680_cov_6.612208_g8571_i0.p1  ORF type:complete len:184 (-),score=27.44 NODE_8832_length_680_cov_6.612208_g8571_i0:49-600(-)
MSGLYLNATRQQRGKEFLQKYSIPQIISRIMGELVAEQPEDAVAAMVAKLTRIQEERDQITGTPVCYVVLSSVQYTEGLTPHAVFLNRSLAEAYVDENEGVEEMVVVETGMPAGNLDPRPGDKVVAVVTDGAPRARFRGLFRDIRAYRQAFGNAKGHRKVLLVVRDEHTVMEWPDDDDEPEES